MIKIALWATIGINIFAFYLLVRWYGRERKRVMRVAYNEGMKRAYYLQNTSKKGLK